MAKYIYFEWLVWFLESSKSFDFEWDDGNSQKSELKHGVTTIQIESVFMMREFIQSESKLSLKPQNKGLGFMLKIIWEKFCLSVLQSAWAESDA